jgi:hypothetical protein
VTFVGADYIDDKRLQLQCKILESNDLVILVDLEPLSFIENPDIALIPQTLAYYISKSEHITPLQLEHIFHPKALSPLRQ